MARSAWKNWWLPTAQEFLLWRVAAFIVHHAVSSRVATLCVSHMRWNLWKKRLASLGPDSRIYASVVVHAAENVHIGADVAIAEFVHIWGGGGVIIGNRTMIASHVVITSQTHPLHASHRRDSIRRPVVIGENVWIGSGAVILPGVNIGNNAVVGAGAVVTKDVAEGLVVGGVPAVVLAEPTRRVLTEAGPGKGLDMATTETT